MERKKWTPREEVTDDLLRFREKRKWQVALRRYVVEKNISTNYAPYFGLSIQQFRNWIEIQFTPELNWENFGIAWQFDHIMPVGYFNFSVEADLLLCWNFVNIRVGTILPHKNGHRVDVIAAKPYFETLYLTTGYGLCLKMVEKINSIVAGCIGEEPALEAFLLREKSTIEKVATLAKEEFNRLNTGTSLVDLFLERELLKKFG